MNRFKPVKYAKHAVISVHNVTSIRYGKLSRMASGAYARELFIITADGETVELNVFARDQDSGDVLKVKNVRVAFPSIDDLSLQARRNADIHQVMIHDPIAE